MIGVVLEIGRKTADGTLESLISNMGLEVVYQIVIAFIFVFALNTLVQAQPTLMRTDHYSRFLEIQHSYIP